MMSLSILINTPESSVLCVVDTLFLTFRCKITFFFGDINIFPVIFAGVYTGYQDDKGQKIFTGDVVKATALMEADMISEGGRTYQACEGHWQRVL